MKISSYIACSLDGFIARENGELDWLTGNDNQKETENEDFGYAEFMSSVDALVMGRKTFEKVLSFGSWPYAEKRVIVLSNNLLEKPDSLPQSAEVWSWSDNPVEIINKLNNEGVQHIYVDGGKVIQGFLKSHLIDEITITWIPVLIGKGIPLFGHQENDQKLQHVETKVFPNDMVQIKYKIIKS